MKFILLFVASFSLISCAGVSGKFEVALPDSLGGGVVPIVIHGAK